MPHLHEKIDFTVDVFIVHKQRVLLRMHDKYKMWLAPGGHIELHEDPTQAAVREVKEEVGLDVKLWGEPAAAPRRDGYAELLPPRFLNRHAINEHHEHISFIYFAVSPTDRVIAGGADRSDEWKWFAAEELDLPEYGIKEDIRRYARAALAEVRE